MKKIDLHNVRFENSSSDCRGRNIKTSKVEMVVPNYMSISAYPLAMTIKTIKIDLWEGEEQSFF